MYVSLYRKYRPGRFDDVVGQDGIVRVLKNSLRSGRVAHAFLFSGPRGCGKTSVARILAKALNCPNSADGEPCDNCYVCNSISTGECLDVIEIDGASNRGIEEIRNLKAQIGLASFSLPYKVYIIDEVHMLTDAAFNALLKTLEEPPMQVVFVLATTEPDKVPLTIRSRCLCFYFNRLLTSDIVRRLRQVAQEEGFAFEEEALWELARQSDGSLRDALTLAEQALSLQEGNLSMESIAMLLGSTRGKIEEAIKLIPHNPPQAFVKIKEILSKGLSVERFLEMAFAVFRDMWAYKSYGKDFAVELELSDREIKFLEEESPFWKDDVLLSCMRLCGELCLQAKLGVKDDILFGLFLSQMDRVDFPSAGESPPLPLKPKAENVTESFTTAPWQEIMKQACEEMLPLYCALICSKVTLDEKRIVIEISERRRFDFNLLKLSRNLAYLYGLITKRFNDVTEIILKCGVDEVKYSDEQEKAQMEGDAEGFRQEELPQAFEEEPQPHEEGLKPAVKLAERREVKEEDIVLQRIAMYLNGDVLMYKKLDEEENIEEDGGVEVE